MTRTLLGASVLLAAAATARIGPPTIADLLVARQGTDYVVSGRLVDGLSPAMQEEIEAGIETTLGYRLQLYRRRPGLPDDLTAHRLVECTVQHDALTRQYTLTRRVDGEIAETRVTSDPPEMREFLTILRGIPLAHDEDLQPGESYYARARCDLGLIWRFYLIPWRMNTDWARAEISVVEKEAKDVENGRP